MMKCKIQIGLILIGLCGTSPTTSAAENANTVILNRLGNQISRTYPGSHVTFLSPIRWVRGGIGNDANDEGAENQDATITILGDDGKGNMHFSAKAPNLPESEGWVGFSAKVPARICTKRIRPGDFLREDMFRVEQVDISNGMGREFRGVLFPGDSKLAGLESIQTVLEGQFLTSASIQRTPDIRRGDSVQIKLISGALTLSTMGIAEEPAYVSKKVRVMAGKSKKELSGLLRPGNIVEVTL